MDLITKEIAEFLERQRLGYVATVSPDHRPNVSPKGTIIKLDGNNLIFADIRSPDTVRNLETNPNVEISVIDPVLRRGYMFQGTGRIADEPSAVARALERYREMGVKSPIRSIVVVRVSSVSAVVSPLYDLGVTEQEIRAIWRARLDDA